MASELSITDLGQPLLAVATALPNWARGDRDEAIALTLDLAARNAHTRAYVAWVWGATGDDGDAIWLVPVASQDAERSAPKAPVQMLLRCVRAAVAAGADPASLAYIDWDGLVGIIAPGADPLLAPLALAEAHPAPARAEFVAVELRADGPPLDLMAPRDRTAGGLAALAGTIRAHPLQLAAPMLEQGWSLEEATYPDEIADLLRHRGFEGPQIQRNGPSLAIEDDPCPQRRFARRLLRRLLHKRKIGAQYHTAIDHLAHGVPPDDRAGAYAVGEALIRAGLLGEKPSVGQRHVYLRREALPAIHALIDRGETDDGALAELWSAPAPRQCMPL